LKLDIDDGSIEFKTNNFIPVSLNFANSNWDDNKRFKFFIKDYDYILQEKENFFNPEAEYYISNPEDYEEVEFSSEEKYNRYKIK
jgi:hypothetical protein